MRSSLFFALLAPSLLAQSLPTSNPSTRAALDIIKSASVAAIDAKVQKALVDALTVENARGTGPRAAAAKLSLVVDTMGIRPTGAQSDAAPIVQTALNAAKALGVTSSTGASSTDANLPISLGIPAIRVEGGGIGGGSHSLGEWYSDGPNGWMGPQWAALTVAGLAGVR